MARCSCPPVSRCRLRRLRTARLQLSRRHYMPGSSRVRWQMYRVIRMHGSVGSSPPTTSPSRSSL